MAKTRSNAEASGGTGGAGGGDKQPNNGGDGHKQPALIEPDYDEVEEDRLRAAAEAAVDLSNALAPVEGTPRETLAELYHAIGQLEHLVDVRGIRLDNLGIDLAGARQTLTQALTRRNFDFDALVRPSRRPSPDVTVHDILYRLEAIRTSSMITAAAHLATGTTGSRVGQIERSVVESARLSARFRANAPDRDRRLSDLAAATGNAAAARALLPGSGAATGATTGPGTTRLDALEQTLAESARLAVAGLRGLDRLGNVAAATGSATGAARAAAAAAANEGEDEHKKEMAAFIKRAAARERRTKKRIDRTRAIAEEAKADAERIEEEVDERIEEVEARLDGVEARTDRLEEQVAELALNAQDEEEEEDSESDDAEEEESDEE